MTTVYTFAAIYTKAGVATAPSSAPTIQVVDSADNILVAALTAVTASVNMPGAYYYAYTGADNLVCWALFHTTDTTVDQQDLASYTPAQTYTVKTNVATILADYARRTGDYAVAGDAMALVNDAITSAKFDESTAYPLKSADSGSTQIARKGADSDTLETLSDQIDTIDSSSVAAAVWASSTRTLTQAAAAADTGTASAITRKRGNSWSISITGLGTLTGYTSIWFTIKSSPSDTDTQALLMVKKNASGLTDGLIYLNGAAGTAAQGSITIDDATDGDITIVVDEAATDDLEPGTYCQDVQTLISGAVATPSSGTFTVQADTTRAIT